MMTFSPLFYSCAYRFLTGGLFPEKVEGNPLAGEVEGLTAFLDVKADLRVDLPPVLDEIEGKVAVGLHDPLVVGLLRWFCPREGGYRYVKEKHTQQHHNR